MYGIVSIVEGPLGAQIEHAWTDLRAKHGPAATHGHNLPHLSYHVADDYDRPALEVLFARLAATQHPFDVPLGGLGTIAFQSARIVFVNVRRTPALSALHDALWDHASAGATGVINHYHPDTWMPHITLGDHPILLERFPDLARRLGGEPLPTHFRIDNLALIQEMPHGHELRLRTSLRT